MNIVFANATVDWGGVKTWTLEVALQLVAQGHRCQLVGRVGDRWVEACHDAGLPVEAIDFGPHFNPAAIARLVRILRRERADCLVVNIARDLCAGAVAGRLAGVPVVRRLGLPDDPNHDLLERLLFRLVDGMVTVGHAMRRDMLAEFPWMDPSKVVTIHTGKDPHRYHVSKDLRLAAALGLPPDALLIGVSSQLEQHKGHRFLLEAFAQVAAQHPRSHLVIAGTGPTRELLERQAAELGLAGRVSFLGFQDDIPGFLQGIELFVLPSLREAFPNALLEAMASRTACIATAVGSVHELVEDDVNGRLVAPGSAAALVAPLDGLLGDSASRERLAAAARRTVEERFDVARQATAFAAYLAALVATRCGIQRAR